MREVDTDIGRARLVDGVFRMGKERRRKPVSLSSS
jgi:hypothetical protein